MIKVAELTKVYPGPVPALRGVSLEIDKGMFGLLGPNGAGKSTFMNIVAGLLEPTAGSVELFGEDILADPNKLWNQLGYLPQEFGFYDHLTGHAMLQYLLKLKGVPTEARQDDDDDLCLASVTTTLVFSFRGLQLLWFHGPRQLCLIIPSDVDQITQRFRMIQ